MKISLFDYTKVIEGSEKLKHIGIIDFYNKSCPEQAWDYFTTFHARESETIKPNDNYYEYFGFKSDMFVIEYGYSEVGTEDVLIITTIQEGLRISSVYLLEPGIYLGGIFR